MPPQAVLVDDAPERHEDATDDGLGGVRPVQPLQQGEGLGHGAAGEPRPTCWVLLVGLAVYLYQKVIPFLPNIWVSGTSRRCTFACRPTEDPFMFTCAFFLYSFDYLWEGGEEEERIKCI